MFTIPVTVSEKILSEIIAHINKGGESIVKDVSTKRAIKKAIEHAAERFAREYPNKELAKALTVDTQFYDLPSVQQAVHELLEHPFNPAPQVVIENEFAMVLPENQKKQVNDAARGYLEILREELIGIEKLNDKLKLIFLKRTAQATERTANGVEQLVDARKISSKGVENAAQKYLEYILQTNQYIDPRGIMQTRRSVALKLDEVYISLGAQRETRLIRTDKLHQQNADEQTVENILTASTVDTLLEEQAFEEPVDLSATIRENQFLVFLGDPGAGKSTLLRYLALQFAKANLEDGATNVVDKDGNTYGAVRFPIIVRVSQYAAAYSVNNNLSIREFILNNFGELDVEKKYLRSVFEKNINAGQALVMLDGLDEVVDSNDRSEISRRIENFVSSCGMGNQFIITSRTAGYRSASLAGNFLHFVLMDLEKAQIKKFLEKWCPAVERSLMPESSETQRKINAETEIAEILASVEENAGVRRLASNPLMLTILALIHRNGARLPSRRVELYQLAVKTLLEDWELARGISVDNIVRESEALRMLGPLAYWMHENKPNGLATEREVKEGLITELAMSRGLSIENPEIQDAVDDFLRRVREHTGLFVERAPQQYGFMHLTFEEYFAAREMVKKRTQAIKNINKYRHDPRWEEVILLAIAFESNDHPDDAQEYIRVAILAWGEDAANLGLKPSEYEKILDRDLLLCIKTIGDCLGLETIFIQSVFEYLINILGSENDFKMRKLLEALSTLRGSEVLPVIVPMFLSLMRSEDKKLRRRAASILGNLEYLNDDVVKELLLLIDDKASDVREAAIEALAALKCNQPEFVSSLLGSLSDDDVYQSAVPVLAKLCNSNDSVFRAVFNEFLRFNDNVRSRMLTQFGRFSKGNSVIKDAILTLLESESVFLRQNAIRVLSGILDADPISLNKIVLFLNDKEASVRAETIKALKNIAVKNDDILKLILNMYQDKISNVREASISVLGDVVNSNEIVLEVIFRALKDDMPNVRLAAVKMIGQVEKKDDNIVGKLLDTLNDSDNDVLWIAIESLGKLGSVNNDIVNKVREGLDSSSQDIREKAVEALGEFSEVPSSLDTDLLKLFDVDLQLNETVVAAAAYLYIKARGSGNPKAAFETLKSHNFFNSVYAALDIILDDEKNKGLDFLIDFLLEAIDNSDAAICILASIGFAALIDANKTKIDSKLRKRILQIFTEELESPNKNYKISRLIENRISYNEMLVDMISIIV